MGLYPAIQSLNLKNHSSSPSILHSILVGRPNPPPKPPNLFTLYSWSTQFSRPKRFGSSNIRSAEVDTFFGPLNFGSEPLNKNRYTVIISLLCSDGICKEQSTCKEHKRQIWSKGTLRAARNNITRALVKECMHDQWQMNGRSSRHAVSGRSQCFFHMTFILIK